LPLQGNALNERHWIEDFTCSVFVQDRLLLPGEMNAVGIAEDLQRGIKRSSKNMELFD